jgi:hypothetical protein
MWWVVAVVAVVVVVATHVTWTAGRVDRLHARVRAARSALESHLRRRAEVAVELSESLSRPELGEVASAAQAAYPEDRELAENDLTLALRVLGEVDPAPWDEMVAVSRRVALARQVHNDSVRDALAIRRQLVVRALRLGRKHPQPTYFDVDDPTLDEYAIR